jgi:hypothetical protein
VRVVVFDAETRQAADESAGRAADARAGDGRGQWARGEDGADAGDGERREAQQKAGRAADGRARARALRHVLHLLVAVLLDVGDLRVLAPRRLGAFRHDADGIAFEPLAQKLTHGVARRLLIIE